MSVHMTNQTTLILDCTTRSCVCCKTFLDCEKALSLIDEDYCDEFISAGRMMGGDDALEKLIRQEQFEVLRDAVNTWGTTAQTDVCIEEMSELTKALLKLRRFIAESSTPTNGDYAKLVDAVREEIADVQLTLDQMRIIYGHTDNIEAMKVELLRERLAVYKEEADVRQVHPLLRKLREKQV